MKLRQLLKHHQSIEQLQVKYDYTSFDWVDLGFVCRGVDNNEGYSRIYLALGKQPNDKSKKKEYEVLRMTHKYFYTFSANPHYVDVEYWGWTGRLYDYIRDYLRKKV